VGGVWASLVFTANARATDDNERLSLGVRNAREGICSLRSEGPVLCRARAKGRERERQTARELGVPNHAPRVERDGTGKRWSGLWPRQTVSGCVLVCGNGCLSVVWRGRTVLTAAPCRFVGFRHSSHARVRIRTVYRRSCVCVCGVWKAVGGGANFVCPAPCVGVCVCAQREGSMAVKLLLVVSEAPHQTTRPGSILRGVQIYLHAGTR
jgi:hypothetical protein